MKIQYLAGAAFLATQVTLATVALWGLANEPPARADVPPPSDPGAPPPTAGEPPQLDVVFAIDATGSMGDEIEQVKQHLWQVATRIQEGTPRPEVRFGLVIYRDRTDAEHTRVVPLTYDVEAIHTALMNIRASGGGDFPEDVDAALQLVVHQMNWGDRGDAERMAFLIGDAPPHDYGVDRNALLGQAQQQRIEITTIQASGMTDHGARAFTQIAQLTGGAAEVLTYTQQVQVADGRRTLMRRGGRSYITRRALTEEERALSFEELEAAEVLDAYAGPAPGSGAAAPAAVAPASSDMGGIVARRARSRAEARGVTY
jgi:Mg-chelatase subunit ChlD